MESMQELSPSVMSATARNYLLSAKYFRLLTWCECDLVMYGESCKTKGHPISPLDQQDAFHILAYTVTVYYRHTVYFKLCAWLPQAKHHPALLRGESESKFVKKDVMYYVVFSIMKCLKYSQCLKTIV